MTVFGDESVDRLNGNSGLDWFLFTLFRDNLHDQASSEDDVQLRSVGGRPGRRVPTKWRGGSFRGGLFGWPDPELYWPI